MNLNRDSFLSLLIGIILGLTVAVGFFSFLGEKSENSVFSKREMCLNHRDKAKDALENGYRLLVPYFYEIFYSSKLDTCIYTYGVVTGGVSPEELGSFVIMDYLTGKEIFRVEYNNGSVNPNEHSYERRPIFETQVESYKN